MDPKNNDHLLVSTVLVGLLTKNGQLAGLMFILFGIATTLSSKGCFSTRAVWHGHFPSHLHPLFSCRGHQNRDPAKQGNVCGSGKKGSFTNQCGTVFLASRTFMFCMVLMVL